MVDCSLSLLTLLHEDFISLTRIGLYSFQLKLPILVWDDIRSLALSCLTVEGNKIISGGGG